MRALPEILWRIQSANIYLTFDDGPDPSITPKILRALRQRKVKSTFFLVGEKVARHPQVVKTIIDDGHVIGNHSYSHPTLLGKKEDFIRLEIARTDEVISALSGGAPRLFRPPYGRFGKALLNILKETKHSMILWNASTKDYKIESSAETISDNLMKSCKPGKIILLHDGHANSLNTLQALQESLPELLDRGITFSSIPELDS